VLQEGAAASGYNSGWPRQVATGTDREQELSMKLRNQPFFLSHNSFKDSLNLLAAVKTASERVRLLQCVVIRNIYSMSVLRCDEACMV